MASIPSKRDLRVRREHLVRRKVERLGDREPALHPRPGRLRAALEMMGLAVQEARDQHQLRIVRHRRERFGALRDHQRLHVVAAQARHVAEPVQQAPAHRVLRRAGQQRVGALEGGHRLGADAERMEGRHALQRCERELQRVAFGALRRLRHQGPRALGQADAGRGAEVQQRRFGRLGVVAQRGHRLPPAVEMHRQLRGGDRHAGGALAFERRAHLAVQLHARRRRGAVVQHLAEQRMPEGIRQLQPHRCPLRHAAPRATRARAPARRRPGPPRRCPAPGPAPACRPGTRPRRPRPPRAARAARCRAGRCSGR